MNQAHFRQPETYSCYCMESKLVWSTSGGKL